MLLEAGKDSLGSIRTNVEKDLPGEQVEEHEPTTVEEATRRRDE